MDDDDLDVVPAKLPDVWVEQVEDLSVVRFRPVARWDGHELSLLSTTLTRLRRQGCRRVAIDMRGVWHLRSGYFGLLFDTLHRGVKVWLLNPEPCVQAMLWFQEFIEEAAGRYRLRREPLHKGQLYVSNCKPGRRPAARPVASAVSAAVGVAGESDLRPATV